MSATPTTTDLENMSPKNQTLVQTIEGELSKMQAAGLLASAERIQLELFTEKDGQPEQLLIQYKITASSTGEDPTKIHEQHAPDTEVLNRSLWTWVTTVFQQCRTSGEKYSDSIDWRNEDYILSQYTADNISIGCGPNIMFTARDGIYEGSLAVCQSMNVNEWLSNHDIAMSQATLLWNSEVAPGSLTA